MFASRRREMDSSEFNSILRKKISRFPTRNSHRRRAARDQRDSRSKRHQRQTLVNDTGRERREILQDLSCAIVLNVFTMLSEAKPNFNGGHVEASPRSVTPSTSARACLAAHPTLASCHSWPTAPRAHRPPTHHISSPPGRRQCSEHSPQGRHRI